LTFVGTSTFAFVMRTEHVWLLTCDKEAVYVPCHANGTAVKVTEVVACTNCYHECVMVYLAPDVKK